MNLGTLIVLLIVIAIVALIVFGMRKDKKSGKSSCSGNCGSCGHGCSSSAAQSTASEGRVPVVTTLKIDGMACGMCESHVNESIRGAFQVKSVKSSHVSGITVIVSDGPIAEQALRDVIDPTGYRILEYHTTGSAEA